jgi:heme A synthase
MKYLMLVTGALVIIDAIVALITVIFGLPLSLLGVALLAAAAAGLGILTCLDTARRDKS